MQIQTEVVHYPTLKTILAIEGVVKKANTPVSRNQILARLPTGAMRSTLNLALDYMEKRGMVLETKKGFIWTFNPSKKLEEAEGEGLGHGSHTKGSIEAIRKQAYPILHGHGVSRAAIFGSFARGDAKKESDIDILVEFKERKGLFEFISLKYALEKKLKRKVDLVEYKAIDPYLKSSILQQQVPIL